jgi:hypothetical protein
MEKGNQTMEVSMSLEAETSLFQDNSYSAIELCNGVRSDLWPTAIWLSSKWILQ